MIFENCLHSPLYPEAHSDGMLDTEEHMCNDCQILYEIGLVGGAGRG